MTRFSTASGKEYACGRPQLDVATAPIPAVRRVTIEPLESTHTRPSAYAAAMNRTPLSSGARLIEFSQRQSDLQPRVIDGFMEGQASSASAHLLKRGGAQRLSTA